jgi:hypothetical protein
MTHPEIIITIAALLAVYPVGCLFAEVARRVDYQRGATR